jgi:protein phosphatase
VTTTNEETKASQGSASDGSCRIPTDLKVGSLTDVGRVREINQDCLTADPVRGLFIVADGMGGHLAGEKASLCAVETIGSMLTESALTEAADEDLLRVVQEAIQAANRVIVQASLQDSSMRGMGTTATVAVACDEAVYLGHIGDSRAYLMTGGTIEQVTEDHSVVAQLLRARAITPQEAARHPYRNVITKCLGMQMEVEADTRLVQWGPGDRLLLCSDGLSGLVSDEEILKLASEHDEPQVACETMVALANERGGYDNISVILLSRS